MYYIILDIFDPDFVSPLIDPETGHTLKFATKEEAEQYGKENAQDPIVVAIG